MACAYIFSTLQDAEYDHGRIYIEEKEKKRHKGKAAIILYIYEIQHFVLFILSFSNVHKTIPFQKEHTNQQRKVAN